MKNILVPTDFGPGAFNCIPSLCAQLRGKDLNITFIHLFKLSDSISELLLLSRRSREYEHVSDDFYKQCQTAKKQHPQIKSIKIDFFYGSTLSRFKNYLEENEIDYILHPDDCSITMLNKTSIDPAVLIGRSGIELIRGSKDQDLEVPSVERRKQQQEAILTEA